MPVTRPSQPPRPTAHPTMRQALAAFDKAILAVETTRQTNANYVIDSANVLRDLTLSGDIDLDTLPPAIRRTAENLILTIKYSADRMPLPPGVKRATLHVAYMAIRKTAEAYELEGEPDLG